MADDPATHPPTSYLIADFGNTNTTVALFDVVDGAYRFIARGTAPTTIAAPWSDLIRGLEHAINQVTEASGRPLLDKQGMLIIPSLASGAGVDYFGATISAAEPLKTIVVGLLDDVSVASARRALHTIYAREIDCFSLADSRSQQAQVGAIWNRKPDLILVTGGVDGGADQRLMRLVETVGLGVGVLDDLDKPEVIFAGNTYLRPEVTRMLGRVTSLHVAENVRPTLETEQLHDAMRLIHEIYESHKVGLVPGVDDVINWSNYPILPTAKAFANIIEYFATLYRGPVLGLDLGSNSVTFVSAQPEAVRSTVHSNLGIGRPVLQLLDETDVTEIFKWLAVETNGTDLRDFIYNKALHPHTVPLTEEELDVEQAVVRQIVRRVMADAAANWGWSSPGQLPPFKVLFLRGRTLTNSPRPGHTVLALLDALQPTGIFSITADSYGVLPALGLLSSRDPLVVVQTLEGGALVDLCWVIAPLGRARPGQTVMNLRLESRVTGPLEVEVAYGTLEVLPLAPGQTAELTLRPVRGFDVGFGPNRGQKMSVHGGVVGIVVDARGRPLSLPKDDAARRSLIQQWHTNVGG